MVWVLLILPLFLFMSPSGEAGSSGLMDFIGKAVNFLVLFGGIGYILYKPLRAFLAKRTADVERTIREAEKQAEEARMKLREAEQKARGLEEDISGMKKEAEEHGTKEAEEIRALARNETERIKRFAQQEMDLQVRTRIHELKEYAADLAISLAESKIRKQVSEQGHYRLIDRSIERLRKLYEESNSG
jgi:F-type H+-transporting ATPase subunit b